ncbi:MAG: twitching motility protein PilT [Sporichthyaceae bacterium]
MNVVLDAGAMIAIDRDDRQVAGLIELGRRAGAGLRTAAPVVGQAWRGPRQARLAKSLAMVAVLPTGLAEAKAAGVLLAAAHSADVVDALLALVVLPGDQVLTSDPEDLRELLDARGIAATIVAV